MYGNENYRNVFLGGVLLLCGCSIDIGGGTGSVGSLSPFMSNVAEDISGQKYVARYDNVPDLYMWNAALLVWEKKTVLNMGLVVGNGSELHLDQVNNPPRNYWRLGLQFKDPLEVNIAASTARNHGLTHAQLMIAADKAVEYKGSLVNTYQPTTGISTYLHSLPSQAEVVLGLGLTLNASSYQMLCVPDRKYRQWDSKTHYCMLGNDVQYDDLSIISKPYPLGNDVIAFLVTVNPTGNVFQLLSRDDLTESAALRERPSNLAKDFPMFAAVISKVGCSGSVDLKGDYHNFCYVGSDNQAIQYEFYDKNNPAVPLYTQTLP